MFFYHTTKYSAENKLIFWANEYNIKLNSVDVFN